MTCIQQRPYQAYNQAHMPNGANSGPGTGPAPSNGPNAWSSNRVVQAGGFRVLCVADVRGMLIVYQCVRTRKQLTPSLIGNLKSLNDLAKQARADVIIHTGDFGFYDDSSLDRIADKYDGPSAWHYSLHTC